MKKKIKEFLKFLIGQDTARRINTKFKIIKIKFIKLLESLNIHTFSDPYSDAYKSGKLDINYKSIQSYIKSHNGIYFEIGALDGYFSSPTYFLSAKYNWKGVMVDGNQKYLDFIKLYRPKDEIIHAACTSFENSLKNKSCKFLDLHHSGEIFFNENTIDDWAKKKFGELGNELIIENTPLTNVTEIIRNSKIIKDNYIDLFVLDVEGHEQEVLDGYDFSAINTNYFLIESRTNLEFEKIKVCMQSNGYKYIGQTSSTDFLYEKVK